MRKRILVTGGAGFLGSHLCERLLREKNHVVCVDNFLTGNKKNVERLLKDPHFELIRHDIVKPLSLDVHEIYNLACPASPVHYQQNPIKTMKTSIIGTINVLNIAKRTKAKILQASTSEIYGDPEVHPQKETYWGRVNPVGVRSCYDEGKRAAECLIMDYRRQKNIISKIVRIFNSYGPRMAINDGRVISNFIIQALCDKEITVYGDGKQTRSFCYVDDMIDGLILMMNSADDFYGPVNLGNPHEFTILELAQKIIKMTKSGSKISFQPLPLDDPVRRKPDIKLARKKLNWSPKVALEEGLIKTIKYFRNELKIS
ncbi:MAG TPA: SDR family oxidoreductase [Smithellaceae bacterium]|nr:SDR family oxidoreductase [Smithellaceae bacterium]